MQEDSTEAARVNVAARYLTYALDAIFDDLSFLADRVISDSPPLDEWTEQWLALAKAKPQYDQIRWLDQTGQERLRINSSGGNPLSVSESSLQNKAGRYYFDDCFKLNRGEIFVSPMDLNIEGSQIEVPYKPMIRIGTPLFDNDGNKRGIILINYLGSHMLGKLDIDNGAGIQILNNQGYWLKSTRTEDEWAFMFDQPGIRLPARFPDAWKKISETPDSQFVDKDGLWTSSTVYPLKEGMQSSLGSNLAFSPSLSTVEREGYRWIVYTRLPSALYYAPLAKTRLGQSLTLVFIQVMLFGICWILAGTQLKEIRLKADIQAQLVNLTQLNLQLQAERSRADEANKAKSEFLSNMSHEIRTPLNGVIGFTELLQDTSLSPVQQLYVKNANSSGQALLSVINDILDFSKIEAGMMELEAVRTDLYKLLEQCIDVIRYQADKKGLELLIYTDPDLPRFVKVDTGRLRQVLINLLGNAVKFTEKGEIQLTIRYESFAADQGIFSFSVRDSGIGMDEEQKSRLFKSFSQADSSTTRKYGGTGLGLVISSRIVAMMGGTIQVRSNPGQGSEFEFAVTCTVEPDNQSEKRPIHFPRCCIIVDDNASNRLILERLLEAKGIRTISCSDGPSALSVLRQALSDTKIDAMICDYHMPGMDGIEVIRRVRQELGLSPQSLPVMLLHSSADDATVVAYCEKYEVQVRATKPIQSDTLYELLGQMSESETDTASLANPAPAHQTVNKPEPINSVSGKCILIAEDNTVNMMLAKILVAKFAPEATILEAKTGVEALQLYRDFSPDIIFMDIQMPEMDGIEATRRIRTLEKDNSFRTPIIALTAGATKEEQEHCLAAGISQFITKPIEQSQLIQVLSQYSIGFIKSGTANPFDRPRLLEKIGYDKKLYDELVASAATTIPQHIAALQQALQAADQFSLKALVHQIKGASLSMCFDRMAAIASKMEKTLREPAEFNQPNIEILISDLKDQWTLLSAQLDSQNLE